MAMNVSAQATPMPETMPERRLFDSVRWMQSTATGPTVIEAATPTQMPRNRVSTISNAIFSVCCASATHLLLTIAPARKTARKKALSSALRRLSVFAKQRYKKAPTSAYEKAKKGCGGLSRGSDMLIKYRKLWPQSCILAVESR